MLLTIDDDSFLKARVGRVREEEKDINEADETDHAGPLLAVYFNLPWMNVTIKFDQRKTLRKEDQSRKPTSRIPLSYP